MLRLTTLVLAYGLIVMLLPGYPPVREILDLVLKVPSQTTVAIYTGALVGAGLGLALLNRNPNSWLHMRARAATQVLYTGFVGIVISALFDLFQAFSGFSINLSGLILVPLAFMTGEAAYQLIIWGLARLSARGPDIPAAVPTDHPAETPETREGGSLRLFFVLPVYAFVAVYLPQQDAFRQLEARLVNMDPVWILGLSVAAPATGFILMRAFIRRQEYALSTQDPIPEKMFDLARIKVAIATAGVIGLALPGGMNLVGYFIRYPIGLGLLIIMPVALIIAEASYEALRWRLKYGALG